MRTCIRAVLLPDGSLNPVPNGPIEAYIDVHKTNPSAPPYATVSFGGMIQASANFDDSGSRFVNWTLLMPGAGININKSVERLLTYFTRLGGQ